MPLSYDARSVFSLFSMKYMGSCPLNRKRKKRVGQKLKTLLEGGKIVYATKSGMVHPYLTFNKRNSMARSLLLALYAICDLSDEGCLSTQTLPAAGIDGIHHSWTLFFPSFHRQVQMTLPRPSPQLSWAGRFSASSLGASASVVLTLFYTPRG